MGAHLEWNGEQGSGHGIDIQKNSEEKNQDES